MTPDNLYTYIKSQSAEPIDHVIPILFIMWGMSDLQDKHKLTTRQLYELANAVLEIYLSIDDDTPVATLSNVVDEVLGLLYSYEGTPEENVFDIFQDMLVIDALEIVDYIYERAAIAEFEKEEEENLCLLDEEEEEDLPQ